MKKTHIVVATFCLGLNLFIGPGQAVAQYSATPMKPWSLQACIDHAVVHNVQLKQNMVTVQTSQNNLDQSRYNLLPTLNGQAAHGVNGGGLSVNPFTNSTVSNETFNSSSYGISSGINLYSGLTSRNTINRNHSTLAASKQDLLNAEQNIKLQVAQAFLNIVSAREQLKAAVLQVKTTQEQVDRTEKLFKGGVVPEANLLNIKSQLASEELNIITIENQRDLAVLQLQQLMQLPANETFDIEVPSAAQLPMTIVNSKITEVYAYAESTQPSIQAAKERVKQADYGLAIARGNLMPSLNANGSYSTAYSQLAARSRVNGFTTQSIPVSVAIDGFPNPVNATITQTSPNFTTEKIQYGEQLQNNLSWRLGISLNIPIFNGLQSRTQVQNAILSLRNAELGTEAARNTLRQTIEQAWLDARLALRRYEANEKNLTSLKEAFRATDARFNAGSMNAFEYAQAKNNLSRAEIDLIRSKYDYVFRAKVLDFYMGKPLAF